MQSRLGVALVAILTLGFFAGLVIFLPEFSRFGAVWLNVAIGIAGLVALDALVLRETNTMLQIVRERNVAYALVILAYALIVSASIAAAETPRSTSTEASPRHLVHALGDADRGVRERTGRNDGPDIDRYLASVGLRGSRAPYCAAAVAHWLGRPGTPGAAAWPLDRSGRPIRTAAARGYLNAGAGVVPARDVASGRVRPAPGSLAVWQVGSSWQGHVAVVVRDDNAPVRGPAWYLRCGLTVEANTSPEPRAGVRETVAAARDGQGVYRRLRCIEPYNSFRITHFVLWS